MKARLVLEAEEELRDAARFYAEIRMDLATRFLKATADTQQEIEGRPLQFAVFLKLPPARQIRRRMVKGFPYALIYEVREHDILILAVAHARRKPGYWKKRGAGDSET